MIKARILLVVLTLALAFPALAQQRRVVRFETGITIDDARVHRPQVTFVEPRPEPRVEDGSMLKRESFLPRLVESVNQRGL
jgi:hypothetical protein